MSRPKWQKADVEALLEALDKVIVGHPGLRRRRREVTEAFDRVHELVDDEAWQAVLALEEVLNARAADALEIAVGWAYRQGYRDGRRRRR